jgi:geranylgeranyl diphosphate synthase, type I
VSTKLKSSAVTARSATEILTWSRAAVDSRLRDAVTKLPESTRHIAGYHFGWWDSDGKLINGHSGKAIRPALALLSAQAVGGDPEAAIPAAVAVELVHNFSLLHDDVMDHDQMRRHRPAAWTVFGIADAILAGDALLAMASQILAHSSPPASAVSVRLLNQCVVDMCHGQSLDTSFERRDKVETSECWTMSEAKTGALFRCACSLGALAGGGQDYQAEYLGEFGSHLGLAFQLVDDLLGIWGDPRATGKPVHSDLVSRKKSLPVVVALNSRTAPGQELAELYQRSQPFAPDDLAHATDLIARAGARAWAHDRATSEITVATERLIAAGCDPDAMIALREVAHLFFTRDR